MFGKEYYITSISRQETYLRLLGFACREPSLPKQSVVIPKYFVLSTEESEAIISADSPKLDRPNLEKAQVITR